MEARGEPTGVYMSPAPGTSGPSRQGGMLHPGSFGSSGDVLFGTSPSSYSGRGLLYPQSSSLPSASSFQHGSTPPPFGYMTNYDGGASNSFDLPRPSPPYYPISSSLNSTSPHLGPSQLTTIMDRRQSWRKSSNSATLTQLSVSLVLSLPSVVPHVSHCISVYGGYRRRSGQRCSWQRSSKKCPE